MPSPTRPRSLRGTPAILVAAVLLSATATRAQEPKPALPHEDTYRWNAIAERTLSPDGLWLAYVLEPWDGDPTLVVTSVDGTEERRFRGRAPAFTRDGRHLAFRVPPADAAVDSLELEGVGRDDLPGDSLAVLSLSGGLGEAAPHRTGPVMSFAVPEDGGAWIAIHYAEVADEDDAEEEDGEVPAAGEPSEEEPAPEERSPEYEKRHEKEDGTPFALRRLDSGEEHRFEDVIAFALAPAGNALAFATSTAAEGGDGLYVVDPASGEMTEVMAGEGHYEKIAFDEAGERLAFLGDAAEWEREQPSFVLYRAASGDWAPSPVAAPGSPGLAADWWVSPDGDIAFSEDGSRLFFGTAPRPEPEPDREILEEDRVRLDVWNWRDDYLQPMQLVRADRERERSYLAVVHEGEDGVVQLGTETLSEVARTRDGSGAFVLGTTDVPYRRQLSWDGRYEDAWAIDIRTGDRRPVVDGVRGFGGVQLSPGGTYAYWWDEAVRDWKAARMDGTGAPVSLTAAVPYAVHDELDDHPQGPPPYAFPLWTEDESAVLVYDRHDIWRADPAGEREPVRLTAGRESDLRYRAIPFDEDGSRGLAVEDGEVLLSTFDLASKASGFARGRTDREGEVRPLISGDVSYGTPTRARDADVLLWTRESFVEFPDLRVSGPDFEDARELTDANPQQADYRWGTAELVSWASSDGTPLDGILIKPDGFDPERRYPMMVYFYERLSDRLHDYQSPVPNRASIRYPFYASRGYLVFVPDIPYEIGYPGESAIDAVVPGVLSLVERGFVDRDRIGVQGHSWGGYQIAYMITKSDLFAAAEAGAPVSNMTSAYGGIRWSSGMSRMFQYERTQSRIGGTLWDERDRYIHNSPIFFADKIRTPLLMLHNDEDGAVPWYQGIELFVALRRLDKPVFMLNYNGEEHGLTRKANQEDWAIRMQQFFDHYLLDAPAPEWMAEGVPAVVKGRDLGLELVEPRVSEQEEGDGAKRL